MQIDGAPEGTYSGYGEDHLIANVRENLKLGLPEIEYAKAPQGRRAIIVGAAPSFEHHIEDIRKLKSDGAWLIAVKGMWRLLRDAGIETDAVVSCDCHPSQIGYFEGLPIDVQCFVASQSPPSMFRSLKHHDVTIIHAPIGVRERQADIFGEGRTLIHGAGTGGRGVRLAIIKRFAPLDIFAMDCCFPTGSSADKALQARGAKRTHAYDPLYRCADVRYAITGGRNFLTSWTMACEAGGIVGLLLDKKMPPYTIHGEGMLRAALEETAYQVLRAESGEMGFGGDTGFQIFDGDYLFTAKEEPREAAE